MNYLLDPDNITSFDLNKEELELNILFWICAAGKNGHTVSRCLNNILQEYSIIFNETSPFKIISKIKDLPLELKRFGIGCYNNKSKTIKQLINKNLDLKNCSIDELEDVWGLGCKTARCFFIHTRKNQKLAGLDRHILRFLEKKGYKVPKNSLSKKQYLELEKMFINVAESLNKTVSELDLEIWRENRVLTRKKIK